MPAAAPLEELERADQELESLEMKYPDAFDDFADFFQRNRNLGYSNLCKLLMGERTPKELKGIDDDGDANGDGDGKETKNRNRDGDGNAA